MKNTILSSLICCVLFGCTIGLGSFTSENRQNLTRLQYDMTKEQVHVVMGQKISRQQYSNPLRTAMRRDENDESIDVFYYWTDGIGSDGVQDSELTPVVFRSGKVIGWGREFFGEYLEKTRSAQRSNPVKQVKSGQNQNGTSESQNTDPVESWVTDPNIDLDSSTGIPMYPRSSCIGAVVMGVCKGEILHIGPVPKRCYGEMINGKCIGQAY